MPFILWSELIVKTSCNKESFAVATYCLDNILVKDKEVNMYHNKAASRSPITGNTILGQ